MGQYRSVAGHVMQASGSLVEDDILELSESPWPSYGIQKEESDVTCLHCVSESVPKKINFSVYNRLCKEP